MPSCIDALLSLALVIDIFTRFGMIVAVQKSALCLIRFGFEDSIWGSMCNVLGADVCAAWIDTSLRRNKISFRRKNWMVMNLIRILLFHM